MQNLFYFATVVATVNAAITSGYFNTTSTTSSASSSVTLVSENAIQNSTQNSSSIVATYANSTTTSTEYTTFTTTKCESNVCTDTLLTAYKSTLTVYDDDGDYDVTVWVPSATSSTTSDASQSTEFVTHTTQKCSDDLCTETLVTALKTTVTLIETDGSEYALTTWVPYVTSSDSDYAVVAAAEADGLEIAFETVISGSTTYVPSSVSWETAATDYADLSSTTVTVYKCSNDICSTTVSAVFYSTTYVTDSDRDVDVTVYIPYPTETSTTQNSGYEEVFTETVTINSTSYSTMESTTWITSTAEITSFVRMQAEYTFEPTATEEITSAIGKIYNNNSTSTVYRTMNATLGYNSTVFTNSSSATIGASNATSFSIPTLPSPVITLESTTSAAVSSYQTIISATSVPQVASTASSSSDSTTTSTLQKTLTKTLKSSSSATIESSTYASVSDSGVMSINYGMRIIIGLTIANIVAFFFIL